MIDVEAIDKMKEEVERDTTIDKERERTRESTMRARDMVASKKREHNTNQNMSLKAKLSNKIANKRDNLMMRTIKILLNLQEVEEAKEAVIVEHKEAVEEAKEEEANAKVKAEVIAIIIRGKITIKIATIHQAILLKAKVLITIMMTCQNDLRTTTTKVMTGNNRINLHQEVVATEEAAEEAVVEAIKEVDITTKRIKV